MSDREFRDVTVGEPYRLLARLVARGHGDDTVSVWDGESRLRVSSRARGCWATIETHPAAEVASELDLLSREDRPVRVVRRPPRRP